MKKSLFTLLFTLIAFAGFSQILDPVKWTFTSKHIEGNTFELIATAKIDRPFHIFSHKLPDDCTPVPTAFTFEKSSAYTLVGDIKEIGAPHKMKDVPDSTLILTYYEKEVSFIQTVKVTGKTAVVKGSLNYMKCDEKGCLPPEDVEFSYTLDTKDGSSTPVIEDNKTGGNNPKHLENTDIVSTPTDENSPEGKSIWEIFIIGFSAGLISLITPCVYSMLPLTVTFFTKRSGSKKKGITNALLYGLSIIGIFVLLGVFLYLFNISGDSINEFASNGIFNFFLFVLFVVFAISFFGVFEITLPSSWINKSEAMSDKGGLFGIFFMALTLVLISFSCTAPFIGFALALITKGHVLGPIIGMFAYSLALALPFGFFAFFPHLLHSLPKSGGWLNAIKVSFAFIELALALKFLSNVDLAYHWHFLNRDVFLALWIIIFLLLGLYLLGFIRFPHDSTHDDYDVDMSHHEEEESVNSLKRLEAKMEGFRRSMDAMKRESHISVPRMFFGIIALAFTLYMIPGMWGAPLKAISAFSPPLATQEFDLSKPNAIITASSPGDGEAKKYSDVFHCPYGLDCYFDYSQGMEAAKKTGKPVFLDFTGWSCINCRKMEASVWPDPQVLKRMMNDYIVISMYVDDKTTLPESEQYVSPFSGKKIKTVGNRNSDIQASKYNINSQPYYVLLDNNEKVLTTPRGYNQDIEAYVKFLDVGLAEYKKRAIQVMPTE